jgi:hypothetical protein
MEFNLSISDDDPGWIVPSCTGCADFPPEDTCICMAMPEDANNVMVQIPEMKFTLAFYLLCMVLGASGNLIIVVSMAVAAERSRAATNVFLVSLAVRRKERQMQQTGLLHNQSAHRKRKAKGAFPPSHFCNKLDDKLALKVALVSL